MKHSDFAHLIIGLPGSGKSTFLAALWHVIRNPESVSTALRPSGVSGDRTYLNRIEQQWLACEQIDRTNLPGHAVFICIEHPTTGQTIELSIPDVSGEMYEVMQWGQRECTRDYAELAASAVGAILFLHPDATRETDPIHQAERALVGPSNESSPETHGIAEKAEPWHPKRSPTQVKLVELLQFFLSHALSDVRLAVVISAWDRVTQKNMTPERWLETRVPMLNQFLTANEDRICYRAFGVSAQGGALDAADLLREQAVPAHRIRVVGPDGESNDITVPLRWLMTIASPDE